MKENDVFDVKNENMQKYEKICERDTSYMEEFWHGNFIFIILFYLFI